MRYAGIAVGAALAAAGSPAVAQPAQSFDASLSGEVVYDSNVARASAEVAALRGLTRGDNIFTPTAAVDAVKTFGRENVFFHGLIGYDIYRYNSILNRERLDLHAGFGGEFGSCEGTVTGGYARHQSDLQDLLLVVRNVEALTSIALEAGCPKTVGIAPTLSLTQEWDSNSNPARITADYRDFEITGGLAYTRPTFGNLSVFGDYRRSVFPNRLVLTLGSPTVDGYSLYGAGLRYERKLGARIEGSAEVTYVDLRPNVGRVAGFQGFTYLADASVRATGRIRLHVHFEQATNPSNRVDTTYSLERTYLADAAYTVGPRTTVSVGASEQRSTYKGATLISALDLSRERVRAAFVTANVALNRRMSLAFDLRREERTASIAAYNYGSTRVGLTLKAAF